MPPSLPPSQQSVEEVEASYDEILKKLRNEWLLVKLTHNVSAAAANSFWSLSMSLPSLLAAKDNCGVRKNVPTFEHLKRQLYLEKCPKIHMSFAFLNNDTQAIEIFHGQKWPRKRFPKSKYLLLYEEAHIEVNKNSNFNFENNAIKLLLHRTI